jgi:hypothetical protein
VVNHKKVSYVLILLYLARDKPLLPRTLNIMTGIKRTLLGLLLVCPVLSFGQTIELNAKAGMAMHDLLVDDFDVLDAEPETKFCAGLSGTVGFSKGPRLGIGISYFSAASTSTSVHDKYGKISSDARYSYSSIIPVELYLLMRLKFGEHIDFDFGATGGLSLSKKYSAVFADNPSRSYERTDSNRTWFYFGGVLSLQYHINEMMAVGLEVQQRKQTIEKESFLLYPIMAKVTVSI